MTDHSPPPRPTGGRFALDAGELERAYLARSRAVHPDFHLAGSSADLDASLELSAAVNEAYNTLRDPFSRAGHLLALEGGPSAAEHRDVPVSFLGEMLDLREQIETAHGNPVETEPPPRSRLSQATTTAGLSVPWPDCFSGRESGSGRRPSARTC